MANDSAKRTAKQNQQHLGLRQNIFYAITALVVAYRFVYLTGSVLHMLGFGVCIGASFLALRLISSRAASATDADGKLTVKADITTEPFCQYLFDVYYVCMFVAFAAAFVSDWFFFVLLVIPVYATVKLCSLWQSASASRKAAEAAAAGPGKGAPKQRVRVVRR